MIKPSWWQIKADGNQYQEECSPDGPVASLLTTWTLSPVQLQELSPIQLNFVQTAVWWLARLPTAQQCLKNLWRTPLSFWWKLVQSSTTRWAMPLTLWSPLDSRFSPFKSSIWDQLPSWNDLWWSHSFAHPMGFRKGPMETRSYTTVWVAHNKNATTDFRIVSCPNFPYLPMITPIFSDTIWLWLTVRHGKSPCY